jgi:hypothetical protein
VIIRLFLIGSVVLLCAWLLRGQRRAGGLAATRLAGLLLAVGWVAAVLFPQLVTALARWVGVGRGTDLVLYVSVVAFMFASALQQRRNRELEARIVTLTRAHALLASRVEEAAEETEEALVDGG